MRPDNISVATGSLLRSIEFRPLLEVSRIDAVMGLMIPAENDSGVGIGTACLCVPVEWR
jgi:hypothetical protein